jgi:uncharacterized protein YegJ (DUF2314 family)
VNPAHKLALVLLGIAVLPGAGAQGLVERSRQDEIVRMGNEEPAMAAAFRKARASLDEFLRIWASPPPDAGHFAVKVALSDRRETEYFWIVDFSRSGDAFRGRLGNTPRLVKHVREGQEIRFRKGEIVDWTYIDAAKRRMHGNFTACALLTREAPEEAARFREQYGLRCDP